MIKILFNGKEKEIAADTRLSVLVESLDYAPGTFAAAVNTSFIPRHQYAHTVIQPGDHIEIVMPMQGG
jgi:sulfur carrier protein